MVLKVRVRLFSLIMMNHFGCAVLREQKRLVITLAILAAMCSLLIFFGKVSAWGREVKFRGVVTTDDYH